MKISTGFFILSSIYLICINQLTIVSASTGSSSNLENRRQRPRPFVRVPLGRPPVQYARVKSEPFGDFIVDDDDLFELSKRQTSDDYGHLRFGKRGEDSFDDYGHMRFGRSGSD